MLVTHEITKVRHEIVMRALQVRAAVNVTPHMRRITLAGPDLAGFHSPSPDDHVKLFFPLPGRETTRPELPVAGDKAPKRVEGLSKPRDYTPRRYDPKAGTLDIDFVLHGDGPASTWAAHAAPGHWLVMGGPKGSRIVPDDFDNYVLVGDETGLPSIGRRLEEMPQGRRAIAIVEAAGAAERQTFKTRADLREVWVFRDGAPAGAGTRLLDALRELDFPAGDTFVWVAAESRIVRGIRQHLEERGHNEDWTRASGYWKLGESEDD